MSALEFLNLQHASLIKTEQTLEKAAIELLKNKRLWDRKAYNNFVSTIKNIFQNDLPLHFSIEESIIFPVITNRLQGGERIVIDLTSEHRYLMKKFNNHKDFDDYDKSIDTLIELLRSLVIHAELEDKLFSSIHFSEDEQSIADKKARSMGFGLTSKSTHK